jgi:hypothetical protein
MCQARLIEFKAYRVVWDPVRVLPVRFPVPLAAKDLEALLEKLLTRL